MSDVPHHPPGSGPSCWDMESVYYLWHGVWSRGTDFAFLGGFPKWSLSPGRDNSSVSQCLSLFYRGLEKAQRGRGRGWVPYKYKCSLIARLFLKIVWCLEERPAAVVLMWTCIRIHWKACENPQGWVPSLAFDLGCLGWGQMHCNQFPGDAAVAALGTRLWEPDSYLQQRKDPDPEGETLRKCSVLLVWMFLQPTESKSTSISFFHSYLPPPHFLPSISISFSNSQFLLFFLLFLSCPCLSSFLHSSFPCLIPTLRFFSQQ